MSLLDALDESIATVEAEHQDKGSPTTATLASTAAAPPASCGTYERTDAKDTYRCAANGFYLYKRSETSWCVGKEPGGAACKCYQSKKGWQFYVGKKWTLRADVSLTWDGAAAADPSVPAAEAAAPAPAAEATAAEKPQTTARVQGGMMADEDDSSDDEEVEVAAAPAARPAKKAEPAKKKTSDAFGLAYTPYEVYDAAPARDAESSDDESVDTAPAPAKRAAAPPRAGAKAPPPAHVAQDRPSAPSEPKPSAQDAPAAKAPPPPNVAQDAPPAPAAAPPVTDGAFKAFDPAVLARTVAAYRAPVAAAPDSNEDAWADIKPPEQKEEPITSQEPITYDEALRYFQGLDMSGDQGKITPTQPDQRHVLKRIFKRRPGLQAPDAERDFVFLVALQKYDPRVPVHWRMIHTVFRELTPKNKPVPCPTLGAHWVRIGFQGNDPRTDINRAMRCLALLQLLHLLEKERRLAGALFRAANQGGKDWPFACTSISFTRMAVQKLRSGKLNGRCNALGGVLEALHECHAALFRDFLARIRSGQDRFCALNDIQEGKKPIKVAKPRKPASTKAPVAEPPAAFAALGGLPDDPSSKASSGASLGRRYLVK